MITSKVRQKEVLETHKNIKVSKALMPIVLLSFTSYQILIIYTKK